MWTRLKRKYKNTITKNYIVIVNVIKIKKKKIIPPKLDPEPNISEKHAKDIRHFYFRLLDWGKEISRYYDYKNKINYSQIINKKGLQKNNIHIRYILVSLSCEKYFNLHSTNYFT